jgi:hypothetical protein
MKYVSLFFLCLGLVLPGCTRSDQSVPKPKAGHEEKTAVKLEKKISKTDEQATQTDKKESFTANKASDTTDRKKPLPPSRQAVTGPPPLATSFEAKMAEKALLFLKNEWKAAREKGDINGYAKLLSTDFRGSRSSSLSPEKPGSSTTFQGREEWLKEERNRTPKEGHKIVLGPPQVHVIRGPSTRVTLRLPEREVSKATCIVRDREVTVFLGEDSPPIINNELEQNVVPCPQTNSAHVAGVHDQLKEDTAKYQPLDKHLHAKTFWIRDFGIQTGSYKGDYLHTEAGKWLLAALQKSEADFDTTGFFGTIGTVQANDGILFVYTFEGGTWKLLGISRGA